MEERPPLLRDRVGRPLASLALAASAISLVVRASGGFVVGPLSVRSPWPLTVAAVVLAACAVLLLGPRGVVGWAARIWTPRSRWPGWAAVAIAALVAVASARAGSDIAGGADSSGYLSQAQLWLDGQLTRRHDLADELRPHVGAWAFAPLGYRPGAEPGTIVPIYPAGYPLTLAAAQLLRGTRAAFLVVPIMGGLLVWLSYALGRRIADPRSGLVAAVLVATSPTFLYQVMQPMSDVPAAAWWALAALACFRGTPGAVLAGGLASSMAVLTRPNLAPLLLVLAGFALLHGNERIRGARVGIRRAAIFVAGAAPGCLAVGFLNTLFYGSPVLSGYGSADYLYDRANVWPNLHHYVEWIWQSHTRIIWLALLAIVPGLLRPVRHADRGPLLVAMIIPLAVLGLYLPYAVFEDVTYLRFLLPGLPFLFGLTAGVVVALTARFPPSLGAALTIVAALMAGATNIAEARHRQAFDLERLEQRYLTVGRFVAGLPPEGVIVLARQHSGSLAYYTRAPILRWDLVDGEGLDAAQALAVRERRRLLIVLDEVEIADFRSRFAGYPSLGRLEWPPRARTMPPDDTRVYDVDDRALWLAAKPIELTWIDDRR